ncbi:MAG: hypothetical protein DCO97_04635 [Marivita sp. XM-24bin2]|nr:MAG: hypothetical protein DCO97_04635 [Marivita sp. XM-24bin2]
MERVGKVLFLIWLALASAPLFAQDADSRGRVAFGLNGISDWSTQHPFLDLMKTARPWIGHLPNQWGGMEFEEMLSAGVFDESGWPERIPGKATSLESLILTDQPAEAEHLSGRYVLTFEGQGQLTVNGRARVIRSEPGLRVFQYTPGPGAVGIAINATDASDPIRNIRVVQEKYFEAAERGELFNPDWIERLGSVSNVRFMDWMFTNGSPIETWGQLPEENDFSYVWRGVPLGVMVALANTLQSDPWFNIPHMADDQLVRQFAERIKSDLDPQRMVYVEYSNEVWNFIFEQALWAGRQAEKLWGETGDGWVQYYGLRSAQIMEIWSDVYGDEANERLKRVVAVHTGWPELEQSILLGERATAFLGYEPLRMFDAYAVTGYFGGELGLPETLGVALDKAQANAEAKGRAEGLSRVALREYIVKHQFDGVGEIAALKVKQGSLRELTQDLWPYHAAVASENGLELVMYEGGTHAAAFGAAVEDERLVSFLISFNYSQHMADLYREAMAVWATLTDSPFNAFVDVANPSKWGSWGALRHLSDDNPRWQALRLHAD